MPIFVGLSVLNQTVFGGCSCNLETPLCRTLGLLMFSSDFSQETGIACDEIMNEPYNAMLTYKYVLIVRKSVNKHGEMKS